MNKNNIDTQRILVRYGTVLALIIVTVSFSLFIPGFVNSRNLISILRQVALLAIISEGFTMVLISGELDLSFANFASLTGVLAGGLVLNGMNTLLVILVVLLAGALYGLFNGVLVTKIGIPSLIATLAMGIVAVGFNYMYTNGVSLYGDMPESYLFLGRGSIGPIPVLVIIMLVIIGGASIFVNKMKMGKHMQATGENKTAAKLAGVNIDFYKILAFVFSGMAAALTGILLTSKLGSASTEAASGLLMDAFASALLGVTVLDVGKAQPIGTFIGVLFIGVLSNGMTLAGAPYYMQDITKGAIIILAVTVTSLQSESPIEI